MDDNLNYDYYKDKFNNLTLIIELTLDKLEGIKKSSFENINSLIRDLDQIRNSIQYLYMADDHKKYKLFSELVPTFEILISGEDLMDVILKNNPDLAKEIIDIKGLSSLYMYKLNELNKAISPFPLRT